ncbi:sugar transferase [Thomasclavelia cocleata]|uniref:sugar transferase n=1 Tax=Thomasclavelia cocleata TaxID=69824 RepID=UPI00256F431F|nr:sugar transferase [Thomasclavelia cocleata]
MITYEFVKRLVDIVVSLIALILLSPLFLIVAIFIKIDSKGKVFYTQERVGQNQKKFKIYKFRSMIADADKYLDELKDKNEKIGNSFKIKNDPRITRVGKFIRKYSIDELPQFLNVLKGDMSIVGPRPALPEEVKNYSLEEKKRLNVPQGITCLWQIYERDNPDFNVQVKLDKEYIKKRNILFDIKLILLTIPNALSGKSAY